jgi:isoleucyl-tRNA synthetase
MIANAQPWDNLKFDKEGITEVQRRFFGTLFNTYSFFSIYANIDAFVPGAQAQVPVKKRSELDRWILSSLNSLVAAVRSCYDDYNPTPAARAIEEFVDQNLSNWFVRLSRKRFWHGELSEDKQSAYETLHTCLVTLSQLMSPVAPFFSDWLYLNLTAPQQGNTNVTGLHDSVHLSYLPEPDAALVDPELEARMKLAQDISSMVLSIRKKEGIRVRQPLGRVRIPALDDYFRSRVNAIAGLVLAEVNVKHIELVDESESRMVKNLRLNFKTLGRKCGKHMKAVQDFAANNAQAVIQGIEVSGKFDLPLNGEIITLLPEDVEIIPVDIPGWKVANQGSLTVALDVTISDELRKEGIAREFVNRIQNLRKSSGLEVTDKISVKIGADGAFSEAIRSNSEYIRGQVLAGEIVLEEGLAGGELVEIEEGVNARIQIQKMN